MTSEQPGNAGQPDIDPRTYLRIAHLVRGKIDSGELKPGDMVKLASLAEEFSVHRQTAARGLRLLAQEGRVKRWPNYGYIVQDADGQPNPGAPGSTMHRQPVLTERERAAAVSAIVAQLEPLLEEIAARYEKAIITLSNAEKKLQAATLRLEGISGQPGAADPEGARGGNQIALTTRVLSPLADQSSGPDPASAP